jgi:hypothetical protein
MKKLTIYQKPEYIENQYFPSFPRRISFKDATRHGRHEKQSCAQILKAVTSFLYDGMKVTDRSTTRSHDNFAFRLKMGDHEVEIGGSHEDVLNAIRDLPNLMAGIDKAFEKIKPKRSATLTVKTETAETQKTPSKQFPQIQSSGRLDETILRILETDWGKWRPRTIDELDEALKANRIEQLPRTLAGVLMRLVKKEKIKRWNTNAGYVYILAEKEALRPRGEVE